MKSNKNMKLRQGNGKTVVELKNSLRKKKRSRMKGYFQKILVPLDGSKKSIRALDKAIIIASQFDSLIVMINAVPYVKLMDARLTKKLREDYKSEAKKLLEKGKKLCQKNGIVFQSRIIDGEAGTAIVKYAHAKKFDLISMGSSGKGAVKEIILGSVSNHVLHRSKIPVLISK